MPAAAVVRSFRVLTRTAEALEEVARSEGAAADERCADDGRAADAWAAKQRRCATRGLECRLPPVS
eukprot:5735650-Prymnesium_polylepis.1